MRGSVKRPYANKSGTCQPRDAADMNCQHTAPTFGCRACIQSDRTAWASARFKEWRATYKPAKCPECSGPMIVDSEHYFFNGKLTVDVLCPRMDSDGELTCGIEIKVALE